MPEQDGINIKLVMDMDDASLKAEFDKIKKAYVALQRELAPLLKKARSQLLVKGELDDDTSAQLARLNGIKRILAQENGIYSASAQQRSKIRRQKIADDKKFQKEEEKFLSDVEKSELADLRRIDSVLKKEEAQRQEAARIYKQKNADLKKYNEDREKLLAQQSAFSDPRNVRPAVQKQMEALAALQARADYRRNTGASNRFQQQSDFKNALTDFRSSASTVSSTGKDWSKAVTAKEELDDKNGSASGLVAGLTKAYALVQLVRTGFYAIKGTADSIGKHLAVGVNYNNILEESRLTIAGMALSFGKIVDASGSAVSEAEKYGAALQISERIQKDLQNASLKTKASFSDLARGFTEGFAPMMQAGLKENQLAAFTTRFTQTMSALRVPLREIGQEMRGLIGGDSNPRTSRVAFQMFQPWLLAGKNVKEELNKLIKEDKFFDWFMSKTKELGEAGEQSMGTYAGALSNLKEGLERALGLGTQDLYDQLKSNLLDATDAIFTFDSAGKVVFNQTFVDMIKVAADGAAKITEALATTFIAIVRPGGVFDTLRDSFRLTIGDMKSTWASFDALTGGVGSGLKQSVDKEFGDTLWKKGINLSPAGMLFKAGGMITNSSSPKSLTQAGGEAMDEYTNWFNRVTGNDKTPLDGPKYPVQGTGAMANPRSPLLNQNEPMKKNRKFDAQAAADQLYTLLGQQHEQGSDKVVKGLVAQENALASIQAIIKDRLSDASATTEVEKRQLQVMEKLEDLEKQRLDTLRKIKNLKAEMLPKGVTKAGLTSEANEAFASAGFSAVEQALIDIDKLKETSLPSSKGTQIELMKDQMKDAEKEVEAIRKKNHEARIKKDVKAEEIKAKAYMDAMEKQARRFDNLVKRPLEDAMVAGAMQGGKAFLDAIKGGFAANLGAGAESMMTSIMSRLGGVTSIKNDAGEIVGYKNRDNNETYNTEQEAGAGSKAGQNVQTAMILGGSALSGYASGRQNQKGSTTGAVASGFMGGMATGNVYVAIAAAIVGGIASAMGKAETQSKYKFGTPSISKDGVASFGNAENFRDIEIEQIKQRIQAQYDTFWNGYIDIMLQFPAFDMVLGEMDAILGNFQSRASGNFLKHLDEWINDTLPDEISASFEGKLGSLFGSVGMMAGSFSKILETLNRLDPSRKMEALKNLAAGMVAIDEAMDFFTQSDWSKRGQGGRKRPVRTGMPGFDTDRAVAGVKAERDRTFAQQMEIDDTKIVAVANAVMTMTGEAQINKARELGQLMQDRMEKEKAYLLQLLSLQESIAKQAGGLIDEWTAEGMKTSDGKADVQAQIDFWRAKADEIMHNLNTSNSPEQTEMYWNEYLALIQKIKGLGASLGPENEEAIRKWAIEAVKIGQEAFMERIKQLGDSLQDLNTAFIDSIDPALDAFAGKLTESGDALGSAVDGARDAIIRFRDTVNEAIDGIRNGNKGDNSTGGVTASSSTSSSMKTYPDRVIKRRRMVG